MQHLLLVIAALFSTQVYATIDTNIVTDNEFSVEKKGLKIITEINRRDTGFGDSKATLKMRLTNRRGEESLRTLKLKTLEIIGEGYKSLTIFDSLRDIKGTAFLSYTHALVPDDQWLYLPVLKRVKRISSNN